MISQVTTGRGKDFYQPVETRMDRASQGESGRMIAPSLASALSPIAPALQEVERQLRDAMRSRDPFADALIGYGWSLGGKRLRPALLLLSASAAGKVTEESIRLAAVVELVHTATLVHDDVIDGASYRRHVPTVNSQWDTHCSILLGDFLFTQAYYMASLSDSPIPSRLIGSAAKQVCEGEIRQRGTIDRWDLPEHEYFDILRAKTAELCAVSSHLGARTAGASDEMVARLEQYGRDLGIAFQIFDDWMDIWGDAVATGKSLGTDLETGKPTLPVLRLLEGLSLRERAEVIRILRGPKDERMSQLKPLLDASDASRYTLESAYRFIESAKEQLRGLPESACRDSLEFLADFSIARRK